MVAGVDEAGRGPLAGPVPWKRKALKVTEVTEVTIGIYLIDIDIW